MYQHTRLTNNNFTFFQKFRNFDYILLICILLLGFISLATMYSTDGGKILFHTKSHFTKLMIFTMMMLFISFINIKFWFSIGYLSYIVVVSLISMDLFFWNNFFRVKKMDGLIFYKFTTIRTYENIYNFVFGKVFS